MGSTISVRSVAEKSPPMITTASGFCTSDPMPCDKAIGRSPVIARRAVISTVRRRTMAPSITADLAVMPDSRSSLK